MSDDRGQTTGRELRMQQRVRASVSRVWTAWTTAAGLSEWWWNHWPDVEIDVDLRVGGSYRFAAPRAGIVVTGTYLEIREPTRLRFTWEWTDSDSHQTGETVEVRLTDEDGSTRVSLTHLGPWTDETARQSYREGWAFVLRGLAEVV